MFPTNRGVCFRSKANPSDVKTLDSGTTLAQENRVHGSRAFGAGAVLLWNLVQFGTGISDSIAFGARALPPETPV